MGGIKNMVMLISNESKDVYRNECGDLRKL